MPVRARTGHLDLGVRSTAIVARTWIRNALPCPSVADQGCRATASGTEQRRRGARAQVLASAPSPPPWLSHAACARRRPGRRAARPSSVARRGLEYAACVCTSGQRPSPSLSLGMRSTPRGPPGRERGVPATRLELHSGTRAGVLGRACGQVRVLGCTPADVGGARAPGAARCGRSVGGRRGEARRALVGGRAAAGGGRFARGRLVVIGPHQA